MKQSSLFLFGPKWMKFSETEDPKEQIKLAKLQGLFVGKVKGK